MQNQSTFRHQDSSSTRTTAGILLGLLVASTLFYGRVSSFDFVSFDDQTVLLGHPQLYDETNLVASLQHIFGDFPREEPLPMRDISWAIDARLWGFENPFGYHLGNVLANAVVVGLLFLFLVRTLHDQKLAALVALAFAVLPIHVEPVAWVMGRKDLLVAIFMLLALLSQSFEATAATRPRRAGAYAASLLFTLLALGSKISAVSLFLALALHRIFRAHLEGRDDDAAERRLLPAAGHSIVMIIPHAVLSIGYFLWYRSVLAEYGVLETDAPAPFSVEHLSNVAWFFPLTLGQYLTHLVWSSDLSMYYRWPHVAIPLSPIERFASIAIMLSLLLGIFALLRKRRDLGFFALFPLALLVPYSGLFYVGFWHADRYFYLASAGVLVIGGVLLREAVAIIPALRGPAIATVALFLLTSAVANWQHQTIWTDSESLWSHEAQREEPSMLALQALAKIHVQRGERADRQDERLESASAALRLIALGFERQQELQLVESAYWLPETAQEARLHLLKGRVAALVGAPPSEQIIHFRRAFEIAPDRLNSILLSRSLFVAAGTLDGVERAALVEESLDIFETYIRLSQREAHHLRESRALLENNYAGRFPNLEGRIARIRSTYYP